LKVTSLSLIFGLLFSCHLIPDERPLRTFANRFCGRRGHRIQLSTVSFLLSFCLSFTHSVCHYFNEHLQSIYTSCVDITYSKPLSVGITQKPPVKPNPPPHCPCVIRRSTGNPWYTTAHTGCGLNLALNLRVMDIRFLSLFSFSVSHPRPKLPPVIDLASSLMKSSPCFKPALKSVSAFTSSVHQ